MRTLLTVTLALLVITVAAAQDSVPADSIAVSVAEPVSIRIWIESKTVPMGVGEDTLLIIAETGGRRIAGLDFKLGCDSRETEIVAVLPGEVPDSCDWELFDARTSRNAAREGYPLQMWAVVALAETIPKAKRPTCFGFDRPASLAKIVLNQLPRSVLLEEEIGLYFIWEDCGDNTLASTGGDSLFVSLSVRDAGSDSVMVMEHGLPSRNGAPPECVDNTAYNPPARRLEFTNGWLRYDLGWIADSAIRDSLLRVELEAMLEADQGLRQKLHEIEEQFGWDSDTIQNTWSLQAELDRQNLVRLDEIVAQNGWPDPAELGENAASAAFLIVQHAELDAQLRYLPILRSETEAGRVRPSDLALLEDRVRMRQGQPQIYGSQLTCDDETGELILHPIEDSVNVDQRRADVGLEPLADYLKRLGIEVPLPDSSSE